MAKPIPSDRTERLVDLIRIGNRAARRAQLLNRERGIPNWYSINGRLISDADGGLPARPPATDASPLSTDEPDTPTPPPSAP